MEKNWFLFFPRPEEAFLHYDLSVPRLVDGNRTAGGRTFAKLIGNGFTTPNLTDPAEVPCLLDEPDRRGRSGHWHQTSNALKLVLCRRAEAEKGECSEEQDGRAVHFAAMHRKFSNAWDLPLRYERFFVVWDARPPFRMLGMSRYPILMSNETASGWSAEGNWADGDATSEKDDGPNSTGGLDHETPLMNNNATSTKESTHLHTSPLHNLTKRAQNISTITPIRPFPPPDYFPPPPPPFRQKSNWAYFTYTPSIAWAFRPSSSFSSPEEDDDTEAQHTHTLEALNVGYLDDEVILGIGVDDQGQGFARVKAGELVACLRVCGV